MSAPVTTGRKPRMRLRYESEVVPGLVAGGLYPNPMAVPRLEKIVVNMGVGKATADPKLLDRAVEELRTITGQQPCITRARKSEAAFKLKEGTAIGAKVTLRGTRMYEFFDRLATGALPRVRDFRGLDPRGFDGRGNYTFGVREQIIFAEIDFDKVDAVRGMDITIVTTARTNAEGYALLKAMGLPLRPLSAEAPDGAKGA